LLFSETINGGSLADEQFAPNYVSHFHGIPEPINPKSHKRLYTIYCTTFPKLYTTNFKDQIAEEGKDAVRWTALPASRLWTEDPGALGSSRFPELVQQCA
jgi:hypothetical protein